MASALYPDYKESAMGGGTHSYSNLTSDTIECAIVDLTVDYTYAGTHVDKAEVTSYAASIDQALTATLVTVTDGVFDHTGDLTFGSISQSASKTVGALVHFKESGTASTSPLICYHDGFTAVVPNGGDIVVQYHTSGIFEF
jgi:hypothetical protein